MRETIKESIFHMLYNDSKQEEIFNGNFASKKLCQHQDLNPQPSYPGIRHLHLHYRLRPLLVGPQLVASTLLDLTTAAIVTVSVTSNQIQSL